MEIGLGLSLLVFSARLLQESPCDVYVLGRRDTRSEYVELIELYRSGDREEAVRRLPVIDHRAVDARLERIHEVREMLASGVADAFAPDDDCLHATSLLHTEGGFEAARRSQWEESDFQFDAAWRISRAIEEPTRQERYQRDWLLAVGLFHQDRIFTGEPGPSFQRSDRRLAEGVRRYPEDLVLLVAQGALLEWAGSLPWGEASYLEEAEELYSRALAIDEHHPVALVRHGWVLKKMGRSSEAETPFREVLERPAHDNLIYRARLGLGGLAEEAGLLGEARAHYQEASRIRPDWQVAHVAIAHTLHLEGSHEDAREVLDRALTMEASDEAILGWWSYELGLSRDFEPLFTRMRAEGSR